MRRGMTLLELVLVLFVLGLLLAFLGGSLLRFRAQSRLEEAARTLAFAVAQARHEAKRTNAPRCLRIFPGEPGGVASGSDCAALTQPERVLGGLEVGLEAGSPILVFSPPYGTLDRSLTTVVLREGRFGLERRVHVVGLMGKVVIR